MNIFKLFRPGAVYYPELPKSSCYEFAWNSMKNLFPRGSVYNGCITIRQLESVVLLFFVIFHVIAFCIHRFVFAVFSLTIAKLLDSEYPSFTVKNDNITVLAEWKNDFATACQKFLSLFIAGVLPCP